MDPLFYWWPACSSSCCPEITEHFELHLTNAVGGGPCPNAPVGEPEHAASFKRSGCLENTQILIWLLINQPSVWTRQLSRRKTGTFFILVDCFWPNTQHYVNLKKNKKTSRVAFIINQTVVFSPPTPCFSRHDLRKK